MSKKRRHRPTREPVSALAEMYDQLLGNLWHTLASGDLFYAELETARVALALHALDDEEHQAENLLVAMAVQLGTPKGVALLRLLVLLGPPAMKRAASDGLAELTAKGVYPPEWVNEAGKATPLRAWRQYCQFGDWERIIVSFRYAQAVHILRVLVDRAALPVVTDIDLITGIDEPDIEGGVARTTGEFEQHQEIGLAEARWRIEEPLRRSDHTIHAQAGSRLPVLRSRLRRLPTAESPSAPAYQAADRAAAVAAFLGSAEAAEVVAADEAATRFWAEVLTGYSSRVPGVAPAQAGPRTVAAVLHSHVPEYFELTGAQRKHLRPAVTAWVRWSAGYRGLSDEAAAHLAGALEDVFAGFDEGYDDDFWSQTRRYLADLIVSDADVAWLYDVVERRLTAIPASWERDDQAEVDVTTADGRRAYAVTEFARCGMPAGTTREDFTAAMHGIIEELWLGDPPQTWEHARKLLESNDRHEVMHELERLARSRRS